MQHRKTKRWALLIAVLVLAVAVVGGTFAYLFTKTENLVNVFTYGDNSIDIDETFDQKVKSDVKIKNTGNVDAYVRAKIVVTWKNAAGEVSGVIPQESIDYTMELNKKDWFEGKDGFWYCKAPVVANRDSAVLIQKAEKLGSAPEGYDLSVEILAQSVQADGVKNGKLMVENLWPVTVDTSGTLVPTA